MGLYIIIVIAVVSRFLPHEVNIGVITALAVFSGAVLSKKQAIAIPLVIRFISDIVLGFFSFPLMLAVYSSHLFGVLLGLWIKHSEGFARWIRIGCSGMASSLVFFLVTNFAFFYPANEYSHDLGGILLAYINGLPFLRGTLIGDIGYTLLLFSIYEIVQYFARVQANRKIMQTS